MIISQKYRFILVSPTKTATQSIHKSIRPHLGPDDYYLFDWPAKEGSLGKHSSFEDARRMISKDMWNSFFKIGFVRNPWDRDVSWYEYSKHESVAPARNTREMTYEQWVTKPLFRYAPQWTYLCDAEGNLLADYVARFEQLPTDLNTLSTILKLPKIDLIHDNKSNRKRDFRSYFTPEMRDITAERHQQDIELFFYSFD